MAGYKMPKSCKKINLPNSFDGELTLDQYKERFGIDLRDIFTIDEFIESGGDPTNLGLKNSADKLYIVTEYKDGAYLTAPLITSYTEPNQVCFGTAYKNDSYNFGLVFNYPNLPIITVQTLEA